MVSIFTTKSSVESFYQEDNAWYKMICKLKEVHIDDDPFSDIDESVDPDDNFFLTLVGMQVDIVDDREFINNIPNDPSSVLKYPCGIYLLNISDDKARSIQEDYGVICMPSNGKSTSTITENGWDIDTSDTTKKQNWEFFLSGIHAPLNAITIVDRYFFSSEKNKSNASLNETLDDSYNNLRHILDNLLPPKANDELITVTIIYDHEALHKDEYLEFNKLVTAVNKKVKKSLRPYAFTLALIPQHYSLTLFISA